MAAPFSLKTRFVIFLAGTLFLSYEGLEDAGISKAKAANSRMLINNKMEVFEPGELSFC